MQMKFFWLGGGIFLDRAREKKYASVLEKQDGSEDENAVAGIFCD